jgi:release factor-specific protein-(glutamine-N5) methyltransferase
MTIEELLRKNTKILEKSGSETARLDAEILLLHIIQKDRSYLYSHKTDLLSDENEILYTKLVKRRTENEPVSYITGKKEFMGLELFVDQNVLIPRPDTEILVEHAIEWINKKSDLVRVLDLCTGSGAIGVSIAKYCHNIQVDLSDYSHDALSVAKKNVKANNLENKIHIIESDLFNNISVDKKYHIIVSNPPYISENEMKQLEGNVLNYEPHMALYGGKDGNDFYRKIISNSKKYLFKNGLLVFEIGCSQGKIVSQLLKDNGFTEIEILSDLAGLDRVVKGVNNG